MSLLKLRRQNCWACHDIWQLLQSMSLSHYCHFLWRKWQNGQRINWEVDPHQTVTLGKCISAIMRPLVEIFLTNYFYLRNHLVVLKLSMCTFSNQFAFWLELQNATTLNYDHLVCRSIFFKTVTLLYYIECIFFNLQLKQNVDNNWIPYLEQELEKKKKNQYI